MSYFCDFRAQSYRERGENCGYGGIGERLGQEKRDCPTRKEENDGSALSEARLCVNVWLAFGRQPWQIALLGWQPGSLSTRGSHLTAATHRDSDALFSSASCSSSFYFVFFFQHAAKDNVTLSWMNGWNGDSRHGRAVLFWNRTDQPGLDLLDLHGEITYILVRHYWKAHVKLSFVHLLSSIVDRKFCN